MSEPYVTEAQEKIVQLIADGYDTEGIARELGIGKWAVRDQIRRLTRKFDCRMVELPTKTGIGQQYG